jgi:hypothetical protein
MCTAGTEGDAPINDACDDRWSMHNSQHAQVTTPTRATRDTRQARGWVRVTSSIRYITSNDSNEAVTCETFVLLQRRQRQELGSVELAVLAALPWPSV